MYCWCSKLDSTVLATTDNLPQTSYADISIDILQCSSSSFRSLRSLPLPTTLCNKSCISSRSMPILLKITPHSPKINTLLYENISSSTGTERGKHAYVDNITGMAELREREDAGMKRYGPLLLRKEQHLISTLAANSRRRCVTAWWTGQLNTNGDWRISTRAVEPFCLPLPAWLRFVAKC